MSDKFSHIDNSGKAKMVDIGNKPVQQRTAIAEGIIKLSGNTVKLIQENGLAKGDVLSVARIAGIQAAKKTPDLIPLCHTLLLNQVDVQFAIFDSSIMVTSSVKCEGKTGVEMEALTAVSVSLLTIYDMCKAVDKNMELSAIRLVSKVKENSEQ
jgi:cyclic pyranopterin monophosphate synthase